MITDFGPSSVLRRPFPCFYVEGWRVSLTEYERLPVLKWFEEKMGPELGANMMKLVPPVGWGDIATKADLGALETKLDGMANRLDTKIDGLAAGLRGEIAALRGDNARSVVGWLLASQAAVIAVVGFLLR